MDGVNWKPKHPSEAEQVAATTRIQALLKRCLAATSVMCVTWRAVENGFDLLEADLSNGKVLHVAWDATYGHQVLRLDGTDCTVDDTGLDPRVVDLMIDEVYERMCLDMAGA